MPLHQYIRKDAESLDESDGLAFTRKEFIIPTKAEITENTLTTEPFVDTAEYQVAPKAIYLVGNSLGLQPRRTSQRITQYLNTWRTQGVQGHFKLLSGSPLPTWLDVDDRAAEMIAPIIGARISEVAVMQTLTANLHFLLCAFYKPKKDGRHKIILETKAFPSDHFAVETQIRHHGLITEESMVCIDSANGTIITEDTWKSVIDKHAQDTAILLLPGIQFYTGQLFDIPKITSYARSKGIFVVWDLAHAVGNVPLSLHDWDIDAAIWCTYKYLNSGPGSIGGLFVHDRNSMVTTEADDVNALSGYTNRLAGWWANNKSTRFGMVNRFHPAVGAKGFQLSNPSVLDITSLCASLEIFHEAGGMNQIRIKSELLTKFLEDLLLGGLGSAYQHLFQILTPLDPGMRGAQLSLRLKGISLNDVMKGLEEQGVIVDDRKPDVIRVAPAPLYNTFCDCYDFVEAFKNVLDKHLDV